MGVRFLLKQLLLGAAVLLLLIGIVIVAARSAMASQRDTCVDGNGGRTRCKDPDYPAAECGTRGAGKANAKCDAQRPYCTCHEAMAGCRCNPA